MLRMKTISIFLLGLALLAFTGCSSTPQPEDKVSELFDQIKASDEDLINTFALESDQDDETGAKDMSSYLSMIQASNAMVSYDIQDTTIDEDQAIVSVSCTYGDLSETLNAALGGYLSAAMQLVFLNDSDEDVTDEDMMAILNEQIDAALESTPPTETTTTLDITCQKVDDTWQVVTEDNDALANVVTGNILSTLQAFGS